MWIRRDGSKLVILFSVLLASAARETAHLTYPSAPRSQCFCQHGTSSMSVINYIIVRWDLVFHLKHRKADVLVSVLML